MRQFFTNFYHQLVIIRQVSEPAGSKVHSQNIADIKVILTRTVLIKVTLLINAMRDISGSIIPNENVY